ncbi:methyl-accepting chemotaxis protein [Marinobacter sp. AN1]|uniref:methyl-accepting chemotaxis protein n=1 Tax=Marinobacter sp. AN1 TaxID=2886046 RepID=UPI002232B6D9|nr:methyl-accepting chemotaxis protein [Marinobacter sp. AN1]UZD65483.1 methyl-accepting chemotaxis protein [Marinobacter sp. AN1]
MMSDTQFTRRDALSSDRQMLWILLAHVPVVGLLVPVGYGTHVFAIVASVLVGLVVSAAYASIRGTRGFSVVAATALMVFSAIMIQAQMGRIEMHFHIFSALALVMVYRDWLPILVAAGVIAVHHLLLTALQLSGASLGGMPLMIFNYGCSWSIAFLHAAFVVFEAGILVFFALRLGRERQVTHSIMELVEQFRQDGDLSGRLDESSDDTARAFNSMLDQFSGLIREVGSLSAQLSSTAGALDAMSDRTTAILGEQNDRLGQAASATEEMTATVHDVARNTQQASEASAEASRSANVGTRQVGEAVALTDATDQALQSSSEAVKSLVGNVDSIGQVVGAINDISEQTNLLALNAAIEAARAGDQGRGFAVVADEVRNLSRRTQEFTREIGATIDTLSAGAEQALAALEMGQTRSRETSLAIRATGEAIDTIRQAVTQVTDLSMQIASATEQQAAASVHINESVQGVASQNQDVVGQAQDVRGLAAELDQLATGINRLIEGYRA